jgi:hypothetical protein
MPDSLGRNWGRPCFLEVGHHRGRLGTVKSRGMVELLLLRVDGGYFVFPRNSSMFC